MKKNGNDIAWIIIEWIVIIIGVVILVFGVKGIIDKNIEIKDYIEIEATFEGTSFENEEGETYGLGYVYVVDGEEYYISTDYSTSVVPKEGSVKTIKYNPENPSEAVIIGYGDEILVILLGLMFVGIPLIMLVSSSNKMDKASKNAKMFKSTITSMLISLVFFGIGLGFCYMMCLGTDSFSIWEAFKSSGGLIIIPFAFMLLGIYMFFATFFQKKLKEVIVKVDDVNKCEDGTYAVILNDESIEVESLKSLMYKYYIYNTKNKEKFEVNKKFKVNIYKYGIMHECIPVSQMIQARSLKQFVDDDFEEQIY